MLESSPVSLRSIRYCLLLLWLVFTPCVASAQFKDLDHLANQLARKLKPLKPRKVAVALLSDSSDSYAANYFSSLISSLIEFHAGKKLHVEDAKSFEEFLQTRNISSEILSSPESLKALAEGAKLDFLILGTLDKRTDAYSLAFRIFRLPAGELLATEASSIRRTEFIDSLAPPLPPKPGYPVYKYPGDQVSPPSCVSCPDPSYSAVARYRGVQGTVVLEAVVSPEGRITSPHVIKFLGYGLDEAAFEAVKRWKLRPAKKKDGTPVAIVVPIEVTFRLY